MDHMHKQNVAAYFDALAADWDGMIKKNDDVIETILDAADIKSGCRVLDLACGTGVLFPYYLKRNAGSIVGVDLSLEMTRQAIKKFPDARVTLLCADAEALTIPRAFDRVVLYNALPHFSSPERLFAHAAEFLRVGGRFTVAHGMSRAAINARHMGSAHDVSHGLPSAETIAELFAPHFAVDALRDDEQMYYVTGVKCEA